MPPVYKITDFVRPSYWRHRGKLDVPKKRFISYPDANPASHNSLLLGWAGWDHLGRAQVLCTLIEERRTVDGWGTAHLTPLLAGLSELMPWIRKWHSEAAPVFGQSPVDVLDAYLAAQLETHGLTDEALHSWMAPPVRRGRPPKSRGLAPKPLAIEGCEAILNPLVDIAATATCCSSVTWAICWMIVSRRRFKSLDNAAGIVKDAPAAERAKVAKGIAELARAFDRERPPQVRGLSRRGRGTG